MPYEDNAELLARALKYGYLTDPEMIGTLTGRLAIALRTEQSARQAAEKRIDAALAIYRDGWGQHKMFDALTESKEPDHE